MSAYEGRIHGRMTLVRRDPACHTLCSPVSACLCCVTGYSALSRVDCASVNNATNQTTILNEQHGSGL